jgi:hypothetical protein
MQTMDMDTVQTLPTPNGMRVWGPESDGPHHTIPVWGAAALTGTPLACRAVGDCLRNRGIEDGALVVIDPDQPPQDGDVVAALVITTDGRPDKWCKVYRRVETSAGAAEWLETDGEGADAPGRAVPCKRFLVWGVMQGILLPVPALPLGAC